MSEPSGRAVHYEASDADPRLIAYLAAGVAICLALSPLLLTVLFPDSLRRHVTAESLAGIPAPKLQSDPRRELAAFRQAEERLLSTYGWASEDRKTIHVPIERALRLTLERGLPGWPKP